jgi:hypothetical protein
LDLAQKNVLPPVEPKILEMVERIGEAPQIVCEVLEHCLARMGLVLEGVSQGKYHEAIYTIWRHSHVSPNWSALYTIFSASLIPSHITK